MHELTGKICNGAYLSFDNLGHPIIAISLNEKQSALQMVDDLKNEDKLTIKFAKFKKRRSLDANAYCWVLIGRIAEKINVSKEEVYRAAIKEIGGNYDVVCAKSEAVEALRDGWSRNGLGWQTDTMPSKIDGCTNVLLYYGSSTYDTAQMSRLINIIVQDCLALGIETRSPEEIQSLLSSWGGQ